MQHLSPRMKVVIAGLPFVAGMVLSSLTSLRSQDLPLLVLVFFVGAAFASQLMVIVWGNLVARRMAALDDRPDGVVQQLALATRQQHQTFIWYFKLCCVCAVAWLLLLATT